jgi:hypothetical protein
MWELGKHRACGSEYGKRWARGWAVIAATLALSGQALGAPTVSMTEPQLIEETGTLVPSSGSFPALAQGSDGLLLLYADVESPIPFSDSPSDDQGIVVAQLLSPTGEPVGEPFDVARLVASRSAPLSTGTKTSSAGASGMQRSTSISIFSASVALGNSWARRSRRRARLRWRAARGPRHS